jgi:predicted small secreted protein
MKRIALPATVLLVALCLAGCTGGSGSSSSSAGPSLSDTGPQNPTAGDAAKGEVTDATSGRSEITTGFLTMITEVPTRAADDATRIVEQAGGRVDARNEQAPVGGNNTGGNTGGDTGIPEGGSIPVSGDDGSVDLTVRIPSAKVSATLDELKRLGTKATLKISTADVTGEVRDLGARITALQASVDRLITLMTKATSTQDLITIESALSERQSNLESLQSQKRQLDDQVDLATFQLHLGSEAIAKAESPGTFIDGLASGWRALAAFFAGVLVIAGILLPWAVIAALIVAVVLAVVRVRRSRAAKPSGQD